MKIYVFQTIQGSDSLVRGEKFNSIQLKSDQTIPPMIFML